MIAVMNEYVAAHLPEGCPVPVVQDIMSNAHESTACAIALRGPEREDGKGLAVMFSINKDEGVDVVFGDYAKAALNEYVNALRKEGMAS